MEYGPDELRDLAKQLGSLRDAALKATRMDWAVILSHTIGVLNTIAELESV
jgi:hypothetical protein